MDQNLINKLKIRNLTPEDNLEKVAELIYLSDNYIYPYLFNNDLSVGKKVLTNMIVCDTIYNYKNIQVAMLSSNIIAMIVSKTVPITISIDDMKNSFIKAGVKVGARFNRVFKEYFKTLEEEKPNIYFANITVDKKYRNMGVGRTLINQMLNNNYDINLDVVKNNLPAVALYKSLGFQINHEYPGFTGVPCYNMTRHKTI